MVWVHLLGQELEDLFKLAKAKKAEGKESLKTFICGRNRLENGSVNYLSVGLRNHKDLKWLDCIKWY